MGHLFWCTGRRKLLITYNQLNFHGEKVVVPKFYLVRWLLVTDVCVRLEDVWPELCTCECKCDFPTPHCI